MTVTVYRPCKQLSPSMSVISKEDVRPSNALLKMIRFTNAGVRCHEIRGVLGRDKKEDYSHVPVIRHQPIFLLRFICEHNGDMRDKDTVKQVC